MPIGIHLEGPFISHEKRGVHPPEHIRLPSLELLGRFWEAARGHIKLLTIAPELPGALEVIAEAARRGICVSLGHSNADYASAEAGISAGARHATHTFNAMRALDHREPGIAGAVLTDPRVSAEIICDGVHVAPAMVELFLKAKSRDSAVLATDAISATGMPDGRYLLGSFAVDLRGDRCVSAEGKLAGTCSHSTAPCATLWSTRIATCRMPFAWPPRIRHVFWDWDSAEERWSSGDAPILSSSHLPGKCWIPSSRDNTRNDSEVVRMQHASHEYRRPERRPDSFLRACLGREPENLLPSPATFAEMADNLKNRNSICILFGREDCGARNKPVRPRAALTYS